MPAIVGGGCILHRETLGENFSSPKEQRSRSFGLARKRSRRLWNNEAALGLRMAHRGGQGFTAVSRLRRSTSAECTAVLVPHQAGNFISRRRGLLCPSKPKTGLPRAPACGPQFLVDGTSRGKRYLQAENWRFGPGCHFAWDKAHPGQLPAKAVSCSKSFFRAPNEHRFRAACSKA